jgi:putative ABC transport system permease protein
MALDEEPMSEVYLPLAQRPSPAAVVMIRTGGDPALLTQSVRRTVADLDRNLPIRSLRPLEEKLGATLAGRRFSTTLLTAAAALAALLAAVGVFGVLNYWVRVRRKEIAIRIALGAAPRSIFAWAGTHAVRLIITGVLLGAAGGWAASRWLATLVYGISARDPRTMILAAITAMGVAVLGASIPIARAMRVDASRNLHDA